MSSPVFTQSVISAAVNIATANPNRDGTGVVGTLYTVPASSQVRIDAIQIKAKVTTTAGMVRFFLYDGTTYYLWKEVIVPAITASATVPAFETTLGGLGLLLSTGWGIRVSAEKAESMDVSIVNGGVF